MKILHVASSINPLSGGPTRSVKGLCRALSNAGVDVTLLLLRGTHEFENPCGVKILRGLESVTALPEKLKDYDLVHIHALWIPGLHRMQVLCRRMGVPYVVSPRGMLDPWGLSVKKWKKKLALFLYQRYDLRKAAAIHVTAELEKKHVREAGFIQTCFVSPNGVDFPQNVLDETVTRPVRDVRTAVFLSRLHPGKGLLLLAEAWSRIRPKNWRMRVVGPDTYGHKADVLSRLNALGIEEQWEFVGPVDDVQKWKEYASADLLVHPSVSENFGITIAEGLVAGLPVICTDGTPWNAVSRTNSGWFIKTNSIDSLADALSQATSMTNLELVEMGRRGRQLVLENYTWDAAARAVIVGYKSLFPLKH